MPTSKHQYQNLISYLCSRSARNVKLGTKDQPSQCDISSSPILICYKKYCEVYRLYCVKSHPSIHLPKYHSSPFMIPHPSPPQNLTSPASPTPKPDQSSQPHPSRTRLGIIRKILYNTVCKGSGRNLLLEKEEERNIK